MASEVTNVAKNAVMPFTSGPLAIGSAEYVLFEVIVDMILRRVIRAPTRRLFDLILIHTISLPLLGGFSAISGTVSTSFSGGDFMTHTKEGALGVPAVFAAQYIVSSFGQGVHIPKKFSVSDILVTAASKTATKPLIKAIWNFLPKDMVQDSLEAVNQMIVQQARRSNLRRT